MNDDKIREGPWHGPRFAGFDDNECGEHNAGDGRAWCFACSEWCYPTIPCRGCELPALRARLADTEAERDQAERRVRVREDQVGIWKSLLYQRIATIEARAERAEAALRKYGEHHTTCDAWPYDEWQMNEGPCTCGLDEAARAALGEQEGGGR